tara:strand:- start:4760 stop:4909 length:150 start_codon:yes stop_codon:yes gene_type:complete
MTDTDADRLRETGRLRAALKEIRDQSIVDLSLDPDWARRIARKALEKPE